MSNLASASLFQQALRAFRAGQFGQARAQCDELINRDRKDVNALDLRGQIALAYGAYAEAAGYLQKCATLRPKEPRAHLMLGQIYGMQGRFREALQRYDRALRISPSDQAALFGKADVLERKGDREKARTLLAPLVGSGDECPEMAVVQARLDVHDGDLHAAEAVIRRHLDAGTASGETQRQLCVMLGKILEKHGRFDDAFDAYRDGNIAIPTSFPAVTWSQHVDDLIATFTPDQFARFPAPQIETHRPIFVLGMPRSGSTLIESILDAHPQVFGAGELSFMQEIVNAISLTIESTAPYPQCISDLDQRDVNTLARDYLERLSTVDRRSPRVVDKYLINYRHLGLLHAILPIATIIHAQRDPVDTCLSCYVESLPPIAHSYASDLEHLGRVYRDYERLMSHWGDALGIPMLNVSYEELTADPEGVSRAIVDYCDLEWDDACLRYYERGRVALTLSYDQVNRPIYRTSVGRADRFGARLDPLRRALAGAE